MSQVIQVYPMQAPTPPNKGEWFVVVVSRDRDGTAYHNAIAICSSKLGAQTVSQALAQMHGL